MSLLAGMKEAGADVDVERVPSGAADLHGHFDLGSLATVIMMPVPGSEAGAMLGPLRAPSRRCAMPLLVVSLNALPDDEARALYDGGAHAVFCWPLDGLLLARTLAGLLPDGDECLSPYNAPGEARFEGALTSRIARITEPGAEIGVEMRHGSSILSGRVSSAWHKEKVVEFVAIAPGVDRVDASRLDVVPELGAGVDARPLQRAIRAELSAIRHEVMGSIVASLTDDTAVVIGTLASEDAYDRVEHRLLSLDGIRRVRDATGKSRSGARRAQHLDQAVRRHIRTRWEGHRQLGLGLCVIGATAVLIGEFEHSRDVEAIAEIVKGVAGVRRVVSHIEARDFVVDGSIVIALQDASVADEPVWIDPG